ncbi:hypothetical protein [Paraburkholderia elongata]|uniref:Uncharacterized protein n=1 Tax=Paraburkholderia elongata TaxID=2675747 RepID=A0A972SJC2_9BURK|nr:hypothetical protein [Paraburkholderia elongata]NPT56954.1 hypothetical protein [Paraburkholderia elongata]
MNPTWLLETVSGSKAPWYVQSVDFGAQQTDFEGLIVSEYMTRRPARAWTQSEGLPAILDY